MEPTSSDKVTTNSQDSCSTSEETIIGTLSLLQEKWVLFIVYHLLNGPLGFNEIIRRSGGVNTTTLSQRLYLLQQRGVVSRTVQSLLPPRVSYELTEAGYGLSTVIQSIVGWCEKYPPDKS